ncbi:uncharacterized protein LOC123294931 [Chrysoperla carnea]|uniref:uncharacterized protein LOC123294931 n=1 Tax=Chrysoperla carnea TaxID=189513 RepID=UPI001D098364|nr:uncharacterized protein LOC123294931 [Chrysoperla carnea]
MVNSCFLCDRKASRVHNISLHSFPKNTDVRMKWLNACGLTINDDVRRTSVCSRHFKPEDICQSNIFGTVKSSIKRNAVPTLYLTNPLDINTDNKAQPNVSLSELFNENIVNNQAPNFPDNGIVDDNNVLEIVEKSPDHFLTLNNIEVQTSKKSSIDSDGSCKKSDLNQFMEKTISNLSSDDENTVPDQNKSPSHRLKRKFFEPRFVSEILPTDFSTPKRAKRTLDLIKNTDKKKTEKIRQLQRQARNLQKKVESLQDLINHLKENRMLTDESGDALMV